MGKSGKIDEYKKIIECYKLSKESDFEISMYCSITNNVENDFTVYVYYRNGSDDCYNYTIEWDKGLKKSIEESQPDFEKYITLLLNISSLPDMMQINDLLLSVARENDLKLPNDVILDKTIGNIHIGTESINYKIQKTVVTGAEDKTKYYIETCHEDSREIIDNTYVKLERQLHSCLKGDSNIRIGKYPTRENRINLQITFNENHTQEQLENVFSATPRTINNINNEFDFFDAKGVIFYTLTIWYEDSETDELANTSIGEIYESAKISLDTFSGNEKAKSLLKKFV